MFSYRRWRHTQGFGVHSPFAYRLLRYAVNPKPDYAFYADDILETEAIASGCTNSELKRARRLLRLAAALGFRNALIYQPHERECFVSLCELALKSADSRMRVSRDLDFLPKADFLWADARDVSPETLSLTIMRENGVILVENAGKYYQTFLFEVLTEGVMMFGPHRVLAVHKPGVMKVSYSVNV